MQLFFLTFHDLLWQCCKRQCTYSYQLIAIEGTVWDEIKRTWKPVKIKPTDDCFCSEGQNIINWEQIPLLLEVWCVVKRGSGLFLGLPAGWWCYAPSCHSGVTDDTVNISTNLRCANHTSVCRYVDILPSHFFFWFMHWHAVKCSWPWL